MVIKDQSTEIIVILICSKLNSEAVVKKTIDCLFFLRKMKSDINMRLLYVLLGDCDQCVVLCVVVLC